MFCHSHSHSHSVSVIPIVQTTPRHRSPLLPCPSSIPSPTRSFHSPSWPPRARPPPLLPCAQLPCRRTMPTGDDAPLTHVPIRDDTRLTPLQCPAPRPPQQVPCAPPPPRALSSSPRIFALPSLRASHAGLLLLNWWLELVWPSHRIWCLSPR
jgi:hypothetical protein